LLLRIQRDIQTLKIVLIFVSLFCELNDLDFLVRAVLLQLVNLPAESLHLILESTNLPSRCNIFLVSLSFLLDQDFQTHPSLILLLSNVLENPRLFINSVRMFQL